MLMMTSRPVEIDSLAYLDDGFAPDPPCRKSAKPKSAGLRTFSYVGADPINFTDPTGLESEEAIIVRGTRPRLTNFAALLNGADGSGSGPWAFGGGGGVSEATPPQSEQCQGPPEAPGTGATKQELTNQTRNNGAQAARRSPTDLGWFKSQVQNSGPWDYKQYHPAFQDFGNYNYGYAGARQGIPGVILRAAAGYAQFRAGTSSLNFIGSVLDDPRDQEQINRGISDANNGCFQ